MGAVASKQWSVAVKSKAFTAENAEFAENII
jgi:hypothetical protein